MTWRRAALHLGMSLGAVGMMYLLPWFLMAGFAVSPIPSLEEEEGEPLEIVVHLAPSDEVEEESDPPGDGGSAGKPGEQGAVQMAGTVAPSQAVAQPVERPAAPPTAVKSPRTFREAKTRRTRRARRATRTRPKRELTKKQERRRARAKRRRARLAKQRQCHELIDQIVRVGEHEWLVGRELARCYRAHPGQFSLMGGMRWEDDEEAGRLGLKVYLSRRAPGDVARAVGFQRGDILRRLNGVPLRSKAGSGFALVQLLGKRARVVVLRDGEEHIITLRVVSEGKLERARAHAFVPAAEAESSRGEGSRRRASDRRPARAK